MQKNENKFKNKIQILSKILENNEKIFNIEEILINTLEDYSHYFLNKSKKFDVKIFFYKIFKYYYNEVKNIFNNCKNIIFSDNINNNDIISFLLSFYDLDVNYNSKKNYNQFIKKITENNEFNSFFLSLNNILIKLNINKKKEKLNEILLELNNIDLMLVKIIYLFYKIENLKENKKIKENENFIDFSLNNFLNPLIIIFSDFFMTKEFILNCIKNNNNLFVFIYLTKYEKILEKLFLFLNDNSMNENEINQINIFFEENEICEKILKNYDIINEYNFNNIKKILYEIKSLFLLKIKISNINNYDKFFKYFLFFFIQFFSINFFPNEQIIIFDNFFNEIYAQTINNKKLIKIKGEFFKYKIFDLFFEIFEKIDDLSFVISNLFFTYLNYNLKKYKLICDNTFFFEKFVKKIISSKEQILSNFFIFLYSKIKDDYLPKIELNIIINNLDKCKTNENLLIIINYLRIFNNIKNIDIYFLEDINLKFIYNSYNIIKEICCYKLSKNNNPFFIEKPKENNCNNYILINYDKNKLKIIMNFIQEIFSFSQVLFEKFIRLNFFSFFNDLNSDFEYQEIAYEIIKILILYYNDKNKIEGLFVFISNQFEGFSKDSLNNNNSIQKILNEMILILNLFKLFFEKDKILDNKHYQNIKEKIKFFSNFINNKIIYENFNESIHEIIYNYILIINDISIKYNENILSKNSNIIEINKKYIKEIYKNLFEFYININNEFFLYDFVLKLNNISLSHKINIDKLKWNFNLYFKDFYIKKCNFNLIDNNYSNLYIKNSLIIKIILKNIFEIQKPEFVFNYLNFLSFICQINLNNLKCLVNNNLIKTILKLCLIDKNDIYLNSLNNILDLCLFYINKNDIYLLFENIFQIILNSNLNNEKILFIENLLSNFLSKLKLQSENNIKEGIYFTNMKINQLNFYNKINVKNLNLDSNKIILKINFEYKNEIINQKINLIKINNNQVQLINIYIENYNLHIIEINNINNSLQISLKNILKINENNYFKFIFDRKTYKLNIVFNNISLFNYDYKFGFDKNDEIEFGFEKINKNFNEINENEKIYLINFIKLKKLKILDENNEIIFNIFNHKNIILDNNNKNNIFLNKNICYYFDYNIYEILKFNSLYNKYSIKNQIKNYFFENLLCKNFIHFNFQTLFFLIINEKNCNKNIFKILIKIFLNYLDLTNLNNNFFDKKNCFSVFYFSLLKNFDNIDKEIINYLYIITTINKNYNKIITKIFLDKIFFEKFSNELKLILLNLIDKKISQNFYDLNIEILENLFLLIILIKNIDEEIENKIIDLILKIIKIFKNNNKTIEMLNNFLFISYDFKKIIDEHIKTFNNGKIEITYNFLNKFFHNLLFNINNFKKYREKICEFIQNSNFLSQKNKENLLKFLSIDLNNINKDNSNNIINHNSNMIDMFSTLVSENDKKNQNEDSFFEEKINNFENQIKNNKNKINNEEEFILRGTIVGDMLDLDNKKNNIELKEVKITLNKNLEFICKGNNCYLCKFIKKILRKIFYRQILFYSYKKYLKDSFTEIKIINNKINFDFNFSYYLNKSEGISRIRNKLKLKLDLIDKNNIENIENSQNNNFLLKFNFFNSNKNLFYFLTLQQIFNINISKIIIDENDKVENDYLIYNCLFFDKIDYIDSIIILAKKKIYILLNFNVNNLNILFYSQNKISKKFWILNEFEELLNEQCEYLNYDYKNNNINNNNDNYKNYKKDFELISFNYNEINELHKRQFLHQKNSIEIFLKNGKNYFLAFNINKRDEIITKIFLNYKKFIIDKKNSIYINKNLNINSSTKELKNNYDNLFNNFNNNYIKNDFMIFLSNYNLFIEKKQILPKNNNNKKNKNIKNKYLFQNKKQSYIIDNNFILKKINILWSNGIISNIDYIMLLNTLAGRTYNDLSQYLILPWIIQDYSSKDVKLNKQDFYRNFSYPIYAQMEESRELLKDKYESIDEIDLKYHSGSHYSNAAFTCYFLVRLNPFSIIHTEIQGGRFDAPDRLFFNIKEIYKIKEKYQELIPEFFNVPEIFLNINNLNLGSTLENKIVNDIILPEWSLNSQRYFQKILRNSFESVYVSKNIQNWIDLIFGYKQFNVEFYNVLRKICYSFDPNLINDDTLMEQKISEIIEMGINPLQLFNKPHNKREKYLKIKEFFGKEIFLNNFKMSKNLNSNIKNFYENDDKKNIINNKENIKIHEMYKYYEYKSDYLSKGEGGLSSFRIFYDEKENNENIINNNENNNYKDIYFMVGKNKILLPKNYKNFIEWNIEDNKNELNIIKPFLRIKLNYKIKHMKKYEIKIIKTNNDGKNILIGYNNGIIEKYKLKKIKKEKISFKDIKNNHNINYNKIYIDPHYFVDEYNIINNKCLNLNEKNLKLIQIYPKISFLNKNYLHDYYIHIEKNIDIKNIFKSENKKTFSNICLCLINSNNTINESIKNIEINDCFNLFIVIDSKNKIYIFNFNSLNLYRIIDFNKLLLNNQKIKFINILQSNGDFLITTKNLFSLFNINGVLLSYKKLEEKINYCMIKNLKLNENIYIFTAHNNGNIIIWKAIFLNKNKENIENKEIIEPYKLFYNNNNKIDIFKYNLSIQFDVLKILNISNSPIIFFKLTQDLSKLICINNDNNIIYFSYNEYFHQLKKNNKNRKFCANCNTNISNSKFFCYSCGIKLCTNCENEKFIIPEYSLKNKNFICINCFDILNIKDYQI